MLDKSSASAHNGHWATADELSDSANTGNSQIREWTMTRAQHYINRVKENPSYQAGLLPLIQTDRLTRFLVNLGPFDVPHLSWL